MFSLHGRKMINEQKSVSDKSTKTPLISSVHFLTHFTRICLVFVFICIDTGHHQYSHTEVVNKKRILRDGDRQEDMSVEAYFCQKKKMKS